jgi:hypothetical protein
MATSDRFDKVHPHDEAGDYHRQRLAEGAACLAAGLDYLRRGWSALSVCPPDHFGVGKKHGKECQSPGKAVWGPWKEFQERLPTEKELRDKWGDNPLLNVGVALGPVSDLVRVDVDGPGGEFLLQRISGGDLPATLEFTSDRSNGGRGLLLGIPSGVILRTTTFRPGAKKEELRFQAKGAMTVLPPSRHPRGGFYRWVPGRGPGEIEAALAPEWAIAQLLVKEPRGTGQPASANGWPAIDLAEVRSALWSIDAKLAVGYDTWREVGMALHAASPDLLEDWILWSRINCPEKFAENPDACREKWATFDGDGGITVGTLFGHAKRLGWIAPNPYAHIKLIPGRAGRAAGRRPGGPFVFCGRVTS